MTTTGSELDGEIDLTELASSLWAKKSIILSIAAATSFAAVLYGLSLEPKYQADAVFEISSSTPGPSIPSEYAGLASLAGIDVGGGDGNAAVLQRLVGRDFVMDLAHELDLFSDPYFNPPQIEQGVLGRILDAVIPGGEASQRNSQELDEASRVLKLETAVFDSFKESVAVSETKNGFLEVSSTHTDRDRAAMIANAVMNRTISVLTDEKQQEQRNQLEYLSAQLADALSAMESTQKAVADFALANSLVSSEEFATRSQLVFELREDLRSANEMSRAIELIDGIFAATGRPGKEQYEALRKDAPVVDSVVFRRLIGIPEALDAWRWPSEARLNDFSSTLRDRTARIERSIAEVLDEAERYASSNEKLASLEREAKVTEAAYQVLIEQVKTQSLVTGYEGSAAKVYQTATAPAEPSEPRKALIAVIGGLVGLFLGAAVAIFVNLRSGVLYSRGPIRDRLSAALEVNGKRIQRLSGVSGQKLLARIPRVGGADWSELSIAGCENGQKVTVVLATGGKVSAFPTAYWHATHSHQPAGNGTAVLLLGEALPGGVARQAVEEGATYTTSVLGGVDLLSAAKGNTADDLLADPSIAALLSSNDDRYDHVVIACSSDFSPAAARAYRDLTPFVTVVTKPGRTLRSLLERLTSITTPDANVIL